MLNVLYYKYFCANFCFQMIIEDSEIIPSSLTEIFRNPHQRSHILKIIIQTLYNLGYSKSAAELELQSKITYLTPEIKTIATYLQKFQYDNVEEVLRRNEKFSQIKDLLNQLKCYKLIREGKYQQALNLIQSQIHQQSKRDELSQELMMGNGQISPITIKKKHNKIIETCFDSDISPNSMLKMIHCYLELEKRGLTSGISPQFCLLKKPTLQRSPPLRNIQHITSNKIKTINFIKFNRNGRKILVVSSNRVEKHISIWQLNKEKEFVSQSSYLMLKNEEQVVNVSWNYELSNQYIAIGFITSIVALNSDLTFSAQKNLEILPRSSARILCLNWNPMTNFLYVGGSFEHIRVFGSTLQQIQTIQPFIRTRNLCFNRDGTHLYGISATRGLFIYYNLFEDKQEDRYCTECSITSFRLENNDKNIVMVTQKNILYFSVEIEKEKKFQLLHSFSNNYSQNGLVQIEAFLYSPWIVSLGQKQFQAFSIKNQGKSEQRWGSKEAFTFDINDKFMVSGYKQLYLWTYKSFEQVQINSDNCEEQMDMEQQNPVIQEQAHENNDQRLSSGSLIEDSNSEDAQEGENINQSFQQT